MESAAGAFGALLCNLANANRLKDKEALLLFRIVPGIDQSTDHCAPTTAGRPPAPLTLVFCLANDK